jgi:hypothetical protein
LSDPVRDAVGPAADAVIAELDALGCPVTRREDVVVPAPWWERK